MCGGAGESLAERIAMSYRPLELDPDNAGEGRRRVFQPIQPAPIGGLNGD